MTDNTEQIATRIADAVRGQLDDTGPSRRAFLGRSALAGTSLLALGSSTGFAAAQEDNQEDGDDDDEAAVPMFDDVEGTDVDVLNYALSLEHLEDQFYQEAISTFDEEDFMQAEPLQGFSEEIRQGIFGYVQTVGEHETTHVEVLTGAIGLVGGEPVGPADSYAFGMESVADFLALGQVFENTGVAAYAGAAPYMESNDLQRAALSIHSVEARHAAILNWVNGASPFPNAFDEASSQEDVLAAVSQFIESDDGDDGDDGGNGGDDGDGGDGGDGEGDGNIL